LVTAASEGGETYAEVAHEAIFRRWDMLRQWIAAERGFLAWRSGLEAARRAWQATPDRSKNDALLMGLALAQAQNWLAKRSEVLAAEDRNFISLSRKVARRRQLRGQALVGVLAVGVIAGMAAWVEHDSLNAFWRSVTVTRPFAKANIAPYVLTPAAEQALKPDPNQSFRECAAKQQNKDYCPDMIVVPAGSFLMGSPATEKGSYNNEGPQHTVTIAKPFAVSKFELTFDEWDTCVAYGDCTQRPADASWGREQRPVIYVGWDDAQQYVAWLSKMTGKLYRLLTEAEYEYATRAGTTTAYPWGDDIGKNNANCNGCGSQWDNKQTAPVGSFAPNGFGLYDMVGNVFEWVEDCYYGSYNEAPADGSAWIGSSCSNRVVRGGSWNDAPVSLRSASRGRPTTGARGSVLGFRVARTLLTP
jgi:formylglycine-generating enzyme required for sulfatase activity